MNDEPIKLELKINMSAAQSDELLERLAHDEQFRELYLEDPREVLSGYGIHFSEESAEYFRELPAPEEIEQLRSQLIGEYGQTEYTPRSLGWIAFFLPQAMPLVVNDPEGDGAR
jgi:putative modified peptide